MSCEDPLASLREDVKAQGDLVRSLKATKAPEFEVKRAVTDLKAKKKALEDKELSLIATEEPFDRLKLEDLLKQKFFYDHSFAIYGGVQGLYDYGPMGCAIKSNLLSAWRQFFILEEQLLEVDCAILTPEVVLQASGHVERFTDFMVKDSANGECFRADHLIEAVLEAKRKNKKTTKEEAEAIGRILSQLDNYGAKELEDVIRKYDIKSPLTGNSVSEPQQFNLMFQTSIGPTGLNKGFLRPETAQGIFVNFQRLLHFNQGRLPFGAAQIGQAFRNEISPRAGLIRVREFTMAEIEFFVDPTLKDHPKFSEYAHLPLRLFSACDQMDGRSPRLVKLGDAVAQGDIANQTLGYFMARIYTFLLMVGVNPKKLRFRQHMSNEMAHYACDCWDAECLTSYGWIECVGCADRSCYDLKQHAAATGTRLVAERNLPEPRVVNITECVPNKGALGKEFRKEANNIIKALASLKPGEIKTFRNRLEDTGKAVVCADGKEYALTTAMVQVKDSEVTIHVEEVIPSVIEPSFGIGRIMYAIFEHSFKLRENDEQRTFLSLPPVIAPYKCSILPLSGHPDFAPFIRQLSKALIRAGVSHRVDESSGSIGRRYARTDQIAIPYGVTIDFDTVNKSPPSVTLRERDSMKQIRVPVNELSSVVSDLSQGSILWQTALQKYPIFIETSSLSE